MATETKLWQRVNSLGGIPHTEYERGHNDGIGDALTLIEQHHDPLVEALRKIAAGNGYYGAQAYEYKLIASTALRKIGETLPGEAPAAQPNPARVA